MKDDGGPAYPVITQGRDPWGQLRVDIRDKGPSLRDWFAGQALIAMDLQISIAEPAANYMAKSAYIVADAMLKERKQGKEESK